MKYKHILFLVFLIILIDQLIKIYVKLNFHYGDSINVMGLKWFQLYFIENSGMAFGMKIMDSTMGKVILTLFRLFAVGFGFYWVKNLVKRGVSNGVKICAAMILAGAAGNLIDSMFYGLIFDKGLAYDPAIKDYVSYLGQAQFGKGYSGLLHGSVVDMFYFPVIDTQWPQWIPGLGGKRFTFFDPIFNFADASISLGVIILLLFQQKSQKGELNKKTETPTLSDPA
ncbi:lipoprotein signal peptidase [Taibaiella sp. KBW10]|uniref:lipoprotein signal peptidase n=1 Tax=Taibaiella sp. KBW10 TaxID=2153357 RepID=UPI000F591113|nr:lipoprotein signal peptidase [Taibaiella sp. KBW10]RQO32318.1 lipoprotein signal peptidase [Taibaiella sp. KBW10]